MFGIGDDVIDPVLGGLFNPPYALLLGRRTYDIFAAYWPFVDGEMARVGEALTAAHKHVVTHGDQPLDWANSHRLDGVDGVRALKESACSVTVHRRALCDCSASRSARRV